ncbi:MAG: DUF6644 family protein [Bauldia sp.]
MRGIVEWLESTAFHEALLAPWVVPTIQTIHILAVAAIMGSVLMVGLRVMRTAEGRPTMAATASRFVPWIWAALIVLLTTGLLLIAAEPPRELYNIIFWFKMALVALGAIVTALFQRSVRRNAAYWETDPASRRGTVVFALLTFLLWIVIAIAGRWIAYLENIPSLPQTIFN